MSNIVEKGYTKKFYDDISLNRSSARIIVPLILEKVKLVEGMDEKEISVLDLGCGTGQWLAEYERCGCEIFGIDGDGVELSQLCIAKDKFAVHDLKKVYITSKKYTIASSVEVAEHLEEEYADVIVESLTNAADIIVFSAAIPYQRGVHHVNCQYPPYWIEKFQNKGYCEIDCIRSVVWDNAEVQPYYAQNMFMFVKNESKYSELIKLAEKNNPAMYSLVHPGMWNSLCEAKFMKIVYNLYYKHNWIYRAYDKVFNKK